MTPGTPGPFAWTFTTGGWTASTGPARRVSSSSGSTSTRRRRRATTRSRDTHHARLRSAKGRGAEADLDRPPGHGQGGQAGAEALRGEGRAGGDRQLVGEGAGGLRRWGVVRHPGVGGVLDAAGPGRPEPGQVRPEGKQRPAAPGSEVVAVALSDFERICGVAEAVLRLHESKLPTEHCRLEPAVPPAGGDVAVVRMPVDVEPRRGLAGIDEPVVRDARLPVALEQNLDVLGH